MRKLIFHWLFFTFHFLWEENLLALCHVVGTDGHNLVTNIQTAGHNEVLTITGIFCCHVDSGGSTVGLNLVNL